MSKNKFKFNSTVESLDSNDEEDDGFIDGDIDLGTPIASFNFCSNNNSNSDLSHKEPASLTTDDKNEIDNITVNYPKGLTPPIAGEQFTLKRCYQFRASTIRKLNELKAMHPDVNAYLNTILDEAILHYYEYICSIKK